MLGLQAAAKEHGIHITAGVHVPVPAEPTPTASGPADAAATATATATKLLNRTIWVLPTGEVDAARGYDKLHLFDYGSLRESAHTRAGSRLVPPFDTPVGRVGSLICFDLRFPEAATALAHPSHPSGRQWQPAQVLTYPSAFTVPTGAAHWETLLRARAIEAQCWVVAAAQVGWHSGAPGTGRVSYGGSMVVDPWGRVKCALPAVVEERDGGMSVPEGAVGALGLVDIDLGVWESVRERMPLVRRRYVWLPSDPSSPWLPPICSGEKHELSRLVVRHREACLKHRAETVFRVPRYFFSVGKLLLTRARDVFSEM